MGYLLEINNSSQRKLVDAIRSLDSPKKGVTSSDEPSDAPVSDASAQDMPNNGKATRY